jgi:hypothetical protein
MHEGIAHSPFDAALGCLTVRGWRSAASAIDVAFQRLNPRNEPLDRNPPLVGARLVAVLARLVVRREVLVFFTSAISKVKACTGVSRDRDAHRLIPHGRQTALQSSVLGAHRRAVYEIDIGVAFCEKQRLIG